MTVLEMKNALAENVARLASLKDAELTNAIGECEKLEKQIVEQERVDALRASVATPARRATTPAAPAGPASGFKNLGSFAVAVRNAVQGRGRDSRLENVTVQSDTDAGGGYLVPPDVRTDIVNRIFVDDDLIGRCSQFPTQSKLLDIPYSSGGITAAFTAEGTQITSSALTLGQLSIPVLKVAALVKMTEEIAEDAPAFSGFLTKEIARVMRAVIHKYILTGAYNATTTPKGILKCTGANGATIVVAKEAAQTGGVGTIVPANIDKLWTTLLPEQRANAVWLLQPTQEATLLGLVDANGNRLFIPPGTVAPSMTGTPAGTIYGRPVIVNQYMPALGAEADIALVDPSGYYLAMRSDAQFQTSVHFFFDTGFNAIKATIRVGGAPGWAAPVTLDDGSTKRSYAAVLATH